MLEILKESDRGVTYEGSIFAVCEAVIKYFEMYHPAGYGTQIYRSEITHPQYGGDKMHVEITRYNNCD
jgi:hypothetical protein